MFEKCLSQKRKKECTDPEKAVNLINIGKHAGSGVPDIFSGWDNEVFAAPKIREEYGPDRTSLTLPLEKLSTPRIGSKSTTSSTDNDKQLEKKLQVSKTEATLLALLLTEPDCSYATIGENRQ